MKSSDGSSSTNVPRLYREFSSWWPLLSAPAEYAEEAELYRRALVENCALEARTLLELGSGGGNNASHLKKHFELTLVDLSDGMLAVSRALNPECEHHRGDMRTVRLERSFDCVFVHDAVVYLTTELDLRQAMARNGRNGRSTGIFSKWFPRAGPWAGLRVSESLHGENQILRLLCIFRS